MMLPCINKGTALFIRKTYDPCIKKSLCSLPDVVCKIKTRYSKLPQTVLDDPLDELNHCVAKYATSGAWYDAPTTWAREVE